MVMSIMLELSGEQLPPLRTGTPPEGDVAVFNWEIWWTEFHAAVQERAGESTHMKAVDFVEVAKDQLYKVPSTSFTKDTFVAWFTQAQRLLEGPSVVDGWKTKMIAFPAMMDWCMVLLGYEVGEDDASPGLITDAESLDILRFGASKISFVPLGHSVASSIMGRIHTAGCDARAAGEVSGPEQRSYRRDEIDRRNTGGSGIPSGPGFD